MCSERAFMLQATYAQFVHSQLAGHFTICIIPQHI